jgi:hypothetical protein
VIVDLDPEKMKRLQDLLPAPPNAAKPGDALEVPTLDDKDLDPQIEHLYRRATYEMTADGPRFVVTLNEYSSVTKPYGKNSLGQFLSEEEAGPEGWQVWAILPNGSGMGAAILKRKVKIALPEPQPISAEPAVPSPDNSDLTGLEAKADTWAQDTT